MDVSVDVTMNRSPLSKLFSLLNKEAAVLGLLIAFFALVAVITGGLLRFSDRLTAIEVASKMHTEQLVKLAANQENQAAQMGWVMMQLGQMRYELNSPNAPKPIAPTASWPQSFNFPTAKSTPPPPPGKHSLLNPPADGLGSLNIPPPPQLAAQ